jgi:hypothetical protein
MFAQFTEMVVVLRPLLGEAERGFAAYFIPRKMGGREFVGLKPTLPPTLPRAGILRCRSPFVSDRFAIFAQGRLSAPIVREGGRWSLRMPASLGNGGSCFPTLRQNKGEGWGTHDSWW